MPPSAAAAAANHRHTSTLTLFCLPACLLPVELVEALQSPARPPEDAHQLPCSATAAAALELLGSPQALLHAKSWGDDLQSVNDVGYHRADSLATFTRSSTDRRAAHVRAPVVARRLRVVRAAAASRVRAPLQVLASFLRSPQGTG